MNELMINGDKRMTVREVAEALGYQPDTIQKTAKALEVEGKIARIEIRPDSSHALLLDEAQVQAVKDALVPRTQALKSRVDAAVTEQDMAEKALDVMLYLTNKVAEQRAQLAVKDEALAIAAPKIESFDALMRSEQTMSITEASKHFHLHPETETFPYLRDHRYLTLDDLPTQAAIDAGYLSLRQTKCPDGQVRSQAVVLASQLETWRIRVVPQIMAWEAKSD